MVEKDYLNSILLFMTEETNQKKKNLLTKEGYEKLVAEKKEIIEIKIPQNLKTIAEAKAMGDLSENFEYKSALEEKDLINSRLKQINELLENVEIIDSTEKKDSKIVDFGSKVKLQIGSSDPKTVLIVGTWEVAIKKEENGDLGLICISFNSPIGKAIHGKKKGDIVRVKNEENSELKILEVE